MESLVLNCELFDLIVSSKMGHRITACMYNWSHVRLVKDSGLFQVDVTLAPFTGPFQLVVLWYKGPGLMLTLTFCVHMHRSRPVETCACECKR